MASPSGGRKERPTKQAVRIAVQGSAFCIHDDIHMRRACSVAKATDPSGEVARFRVEKRLMFKHWLTCMYSQSCLHYDDITVETSNIWMFRYGPVVLSASKSTLSSNREFNIFFTT